MHERRRREQDGHRPARHWTVVGGADRQNPTDTREEVITTTRVTPIRRQKGKVEATLSRTIPESQVDMVIVGLRMLRAAISSGESSEDYARQIEGNAGGVLPTVAEIDRLCAHLDADDGDSL